MTSTLEAWIDLKNQARSELFKAGSVALDFLCNYRKIPKEVLGKHQVGFIKGDALLKLNAFSPTTHPETLPKLSSRDWLAFFIEGLKGIPLAVELRSLQDKYYQRIPFVMSKVHPALFGLAENFKMISEHGRFVLLEGCLDLLTFASFTRYPALTTMTAGASKSQERWLWRWGTHRISLFYNSDDKGRRASKYILRRWLRMGVPVVDSRWYEAPGLRLKKETDLNDLLQQQGNGAVRSAIEHGLKG